MKRNYSKPEYTNKVDESKLEVIESLKGVKENKVDVDSLIDSIKKKRDNLNHIILK